MSCLRSLAYFSLFLLAACSAIVSPGGSALHDPDPGNDASADGGVVDASPPTDGALDDGALDSGVDATVDSAVDATVDSGADGAVDAGVDAAVDSGADAAVDSGVDSGVDAGPSCPASCALGCPSGLSRCYEVVPSNVPATLFDPGASDLVLEGDTARFIDTSACAVAGVATHVVPLSDSIEACVAVVRDLRIGPAATLFVAGARPFILLAAGDVTIQGTLDASADLDEPGPGGALGGVEDPRDGRGVSGGEGGEHVRGTFQDGG
ncbi:MAG: hypothetical protein GXP55_09950, partial [Deltaproteobacteria bacterium]|nr:hypothetical protein [Deltaproteobacteria bacterium]